jgi:GNAT superfamily N-acetyltransferase
MSIARSRAPNAGVRPELIVRPLTPERWPDFEDLFGPNGACAGCWCMYWRIGAAYRRRSPSANKRSFHAIVRDGPPPGLLAYEGDVAVGWCQLTPRAALDWLDRPGKLAPVDDAPVWALSCFYTRIGHRRRGVTDALIAAAIDAARRAGAPALEAYPLDRTVSPSTSSTGFVSTFLRAGFVEVARRTAPRPIMRYELRGTTGYDGAATPSRPGV